MIILLFLLGCTPVINAQWQSKYVQLRSDGSLVYTPDEKGNTIPDFSRVGYHHGMKAIPVLPVVKVVFAVDGDCQQLIQSAIDEVAAMPLSKDGFRGAILLKKGIYKIAGTIKITASGIVLRGEGDQTVLIATGAGQRSLVQVAGSGNIKEVRGTRMQITDDFVPVGTHAFHITDAAHFKVGDRIIVFRPGTKKWIVDLKMDQIESRDTGTKQWQPGEYDLSYERTITRIDGNKIFIDNPIVMQMETQYGGGAIFCYTFNGRIQETGIENLCCESEFTSETDEDHGWNAIMFNRVEDGWVKNVTARYFGYSCVNLGASAKNITVDSCHFLQPKSQITGGRRYSFNNDGQQNLVKNCFASEGRHDYVTGARVCGPNVFYNCVSVQAKADIGPHHRWASGTLYDNIVTDGEINVQDRGNWGTGHGWSGVTQVIWNCTASGAAIQDPWVSGKNYVIGLKASPLQGRLKGRMQSVWENGANGNLVPPSLFQAQLQQAVN